MTAYLKTTDTCIYDCSYIIMVTLDRWRNATVSGEHALIINVFQFKNMNMVKYTPIKRCTISMWYAHLKIFLITKFIIHFDILYGSLASFYIFIF